MTTNNHPAHGPVSLDRLHQISEILSKASAQSDGGNLGYAMADAVKVIDGAIAAFGTEPVAVNDDMAYAFHHALSDSSLGADEVEEIKTGLRAAFANVTAQSAPVVPDEYRHLSELYHAQEKRLFKLAQRIKGPSFDKYAHSPSQAIDVLEAVIFGEDDDSCRAAMLKSFGNSEQLDEVGSWDNHMNTPTDKPAINTDELLKHIEGMEVSVDVSTCDADAGHRYFGTVTEISELDTARNGYILLVQDAKPNFKQAGNSPLIGFDLASAPDCSVEVRYFAPPGYAMVPKEPTEAMINAWLSEVANWRGHVAGYKAALASAPQQENI